MLWGWMIMSVVVDDGCVFDIDEERGRRKIGKGKEGEDEVEERRENSRWCGES
jgi:hypothetical protein